MKSGRGADSAITPAERISKRSRHNPAVCVGSKQISIVDSKKTAKTGSTASVLVIRLRRERDLESKKALEIFYLLREEPGRVIR